MALTAQERQELENYSTVGKRATFNYPEGGKKDMGEVIDEVASVTGRYKNLIQKLKPPTGPVYDDGSQYAYRFCYLTYTAKGIKFTPYSLFLTGAEYNDLIQKARAKGWDI